MANIVSSEYVTKNLVYAETGTATPTPVLFVSRTKQYESNEAALEAFNSMKQCYMLLCGDSDVQADGTAFQAMLGEGKSIFLELNYDF